MVLTGGFTFGVGNSSTAPNANQSAPSSQPSGFSSFSSTNTGFSLTPNIAPSATTAPTLNFSANPTAATVSTVPTTSAQIPFGNASLPSFSTASKSVSLNFSAPGSTNTVSVSKSNILSSSSSVTATSGAITSVTTSNAADQSINYVQLQELSNKWITDFEDLQKILINQTAETTNRDVILASNEDKIEKLVDSVKNLKLEQTQVEQQLDFILSQQKDLEECLTSLEDEVSSYFPELPADDMYKLAENIDSRLKKTLETSKEIITKINDKNRSSENVTNPMVAIGHILNHLTNSIQMLENLNNEGQTKLNDLQKLYQQYA